MAEVVGILEGPRPLYATACLRQDAALNVSI